ncbi:MAG: alpha-L-fucosidase, partial [Chitinophaga sp.]
MRKIACLLAVLLTVQSLSAQMSKDERMKWWREARFGMFIHWGVYAVPAGTYKGYPMAHGGGEWIM